MPTPERPADAGEQQPAAPAAAAPTRYVVLVPQGDEWHIATRSGRLVTTTERTQVALGRIEGKRPPLIVAGTSAAVPLVDLVELLTGQESPPAAD